MDRNPIPFPVPIMSHSISLNFLILPDGEVVSVPPRRATIIPIDRKRATDKPSVTEMLATERRSEIIRRALKTVPRDGIWSFFEARKQRRRITLDEALAAVKFLSAVMRECGQESVRIDQVLNFGDFFHRQDGFPKLNWLFDLAAIVERARAEGGVWLA